VVEGLSTFGGLVDGGCIVGALEIEPDYIADVANRIAVYKVKVDGRQVIESKG
jgi:hypothetical protein